MKNATLQIRIASILYLIEAMLIVPYLSPFSLVLILIGIILLANSLLSLEEMKKNKSILILITIVSFLINLPAAILIIVSMDELSSIQLEKGNAPPPTTESKRIDILLKLGLGMILVSGVLFATTTWEVISNLTKVLALIGMGTAFLGLSKFSEKKLKIDKTTKAYYILGLSFFFLTWVGICYFGAISTWFSYAGDGGNLAYFFTFTLLSAMLYLISKKFKEVEYLYIGAMIIYISIYHLLSALGLELLETIVILSMLSLIVTIMPESKKLTKVKEINNIISYLFNIIIITQCFEADKYVVLIFCIINFIHMTLKWIKSSNVGIEIFSILISYLLMIIGLLKLNIGNNNEIFDTAISLFTIISMFSVFIKYQKLKQSNWLIYTSQILYNFIITILIFVIGSYSEPKALIVSGIFLALNIINSLDLYNSNEKTDSIYQPFVILIFFLYMFAFINAKFIEISYIFSLASTSIAYLIIHHFSTKSQTKNYYYAMLIGALVIMFLCNLISLKLMVSIIILLIAIYLYFTRNKENISISRVFYIMLLIAINSLFVVSIEYGLSSVFAHIIVLGIFILLTLSVDKEELKIINYISIIVPLDGIIRTIDLNSIVEQILINAYWLYILFIVVKFLIKDKEIKDVIATIGLSTITLTIIFTADILVGIYVGILGIFVIFLTFKESQYKGLFTAGLAITIVNIIFQLWDLWNQIPFYLYLLLVGIAIIAFVTYKELNKKNAPPPKIKKEEEPEIKLEIVKPQQQINNNVNNYQVAKFCPTCGRPNINNGNFCMNCGKNLKL